MNKFFLQAYIFALTKADLESLAQRNGIDFSEDEIDYLFPLVKSRWREFFEPQLKQKLLDEVIDDMGNDCATRVLALIDRLS